MNSTPKVVGSMLMILGSIVFYMGWEAYEKYQFGQSSQAANFENISCKGVNKNIVRILALGKVLQSGEKGTVDLSEYKKHISSSYPDKTVKVSTSELCENKAIIPIWLYPDNLITGRLEETMHTTDPRVSSYLFSEVPGGELTISI